MYRNYLTNVVVSTAYMAASVMFSVMATVSGLSLVSISVSTGLCIFSTISAVYYIATIPFIKTSNRTTVNQCPFIISVILYGLSLIAIALIVLSKVI